MLKNINPHYTSHICGNGGVYINDYWEIESSNDNYSREYCFKKAIRRYCAGSTISEFCNNPSYVSLPYYL